MELRLNTILSADVVGYSRLMAADEIGTLAALKTVRHELIDPKTDEYGGRIVKLMGDGTLMEFGSVVAAVNFAEDVQRAMAERVADAPNDQRIAFRIGINIGDIIVEDEDIYGDGVNVASRLEGLATPGGICVARSVYEQVKGKVDLVFENAGEQKVKNIPDPVQVYRAHLDVLEPAQSIPREQDTSQLALREKPSIAVLPFENMSDDPEQEYFSDGISEDIITELSRFRELFVIARNSSFTYKGQSVSIETIGKELGVAYVIEGSVRRAGSRVRVTAQLVETASGSHLWAERYDRELEDIFDVQDDVVQAVVAAIPSSLDLTTHDQSKRKPPESLTAYEHFLQGKWLLLRGGNNDLRALAAFEKAVEIDPTFARAWGEIAYIYFYLPFSNANSVDDAASKSRHAIERALTLDDNDAFTHCDAAFTFLICGDYDRAQSHSDRAVELNPNEPYAILSHGAVLGWLGAPDEGQEWIDKAIRLDPAKPSAYLESLSDNLYNQRNYAGSIEAILRWRTPPLHQYAALAACYAQLGHMDEAATAKAKFEAARPNDYDIAGYMAGTVRLCKYQEDRDHWIEGFRKAGFEV